MFRPNWVILRQRTCYKENQYMAHGGSSSSPQQHSEAANANGGMKCPSESSAVQIPYSKCVA
jgi:hypothetical protein